MRLDLVSLFLLLIGVSGCNLQANSDEYARQIVQVVYEHLQEKILMPAPPPPEEVGRNEL